VKIIRMLIDVKKARVHGLFMHRDGDVNTVNISIEELHPSLATSNYSASAFRSAKLQLNETCTEHFSEQR
jgi:hypothetical protein